MSTGKFAVPFFRYSDKAYHLLEKELKIASPLTLDTKEKSGGGAARLHSRIHSWGIREY